MAGVQARVSLTESPTSRACSELLATLTADASMWTSWSHTRGAIAAACAPTRVGVDVEPIIDPATVEDLFLRRTCTEAERDLVEASDDPCQALTRLWVRKEAVCKATGRGLSIRMSALDVRASVVGGWHVRDLQAGPGHAAAVAWLGGGPDWADLRTSSELGQRALPTGAIDGDPEQPES
jgi:4'-phosphopantetheinyl transferase